MDSVGQKRAILMNVHPNRCRAIIRGDITMEFVVRKPIVQVPFKVYICCSKATNEPDNILLLRDGVRENVTHAGNGKVIGEFTCNEIVPIIVFDNGSIQDWNFHDLDRAGLLYEEMSDRLLATQSGEGYGLCISDLKLYVRPKDTWTLDRNIPRGWSYAPVMNFSKTIRESNEGALV